MLTLNRNGVSVLFSNVVFRKIILNEDSYEYLTDIQSEPNLRYSKLLIFSADSVGLT